MTPLRALVVAASAFLGLAAGIVWDAAASSRDRALSAGGGDVAADVGPARAALGTKLVDAEAACVEVAERALDLTADVADRARHFETLAALGLPAGAGIHLEDRIGRVLAWSGPPLDPAWRAAAPVGSGGTFLVDGGTSRRLAVRRTRTSPMDGVPVVAVCHRPIELRYPLRNRFFAPWSLESEIERAFRVGAARVLPPDAAAGVEVRSASGGALARLDVRPLSARSWEEAVDAGAARRRARYLAAMLAVLAAGLFVAAPSLVRGRPDAVPLLRAALLATARVAVGLLPADALLPEGALSDASRYAHRLPLDLAASPASLALTCITLLAVAHLLRRAAATRAPLAGTSPIPVVAAVVAAALGVRFGLGALLADVVRNSTIELLPQDTVLPRAAPAALLGALLAAGIAGLLLVDAARLALRPARELSVRGSLALAAAAAVVAAPAAAGPAAAHGGLLAALAVLAFAGGFAVLFVQAGTAARAAVVPLGIAVGLFAPLERGLDLAQRDAVAEEADRRVASSAATARLVVARALDVVTQSEDLLAALRSGNVRRDLQVRLWAASPLSTQAGGSSIEIEPLEGAGDRGRFAVNLPPLHWLPVVGPAPLGGVTPEPLAGRGPGRDGRWFVGEQDVVDGGRVLARVRIVLEARAPANPGLPELQVLGPVAAADARELPPLSVSRYGADLRLLETNDAYRAAGSPLRAELAEAAVGGGSAWDRVTTGDRDLAVLVLPEMRDGVAAGYHAFSYDTGGPRRTALRLARTVLCGSLVAALLLAATVRRWARGARARVAHRLILSYVVVSGLPLLLLGWANRELARTRAEEAAQRELRQAVALVDAELQKGGGDVLTNLSEMREDVREERLRAIAYGIGHHANVFVDAALVRAIVHGVGRDDDAFVDAELLASSDQGLADTELLPRRLPGPVYRDVILLGRPFFPVTAQVGDSVFDIGYAPLRTGGADAGDVVGAVSVPLLQQRRIWERELADAVTAILALYLAGLGAAVGAGVWLARRLTVPLRDLREATQRVAAGDLSRPVPETGPGELGEVAGAFNRMQRDLAESRARLVKAEKEAAWRDMARQVAHEVKNPLTPMRLAAEHVRRAWRDRAPNFDEVLDRGIDVIVRQTESLKRIATAFSDFARLPGRRREPVDLADAVRGVLDLYANTPHLTLRADLATALPPVEADPDEMRRVLVNLAKNAVEAFDGRPGTLSVRLRRDGASAVLEVADDGPGIPDDVRPRLFEPYFSTKTAGTGLGLAICKRAVEDLGGTIDIASRAGAGTTVTLRLPLTAGSP